MTTMNHNAGIKKHDFRLPKKFGKDQLRSIENLYENFARSVTSYLSTTTRLECEVVIQNIDIMRYAHYIQDVEDREVVFTFDVTPIEKTMQEMSMSAFFKPAIGFFLVDKFLGGSGTDVEIQREFTEIELALFEHFVKKLIPYIEESWSKYLDVMIAQRTIEANPKLVQVFTSEDVVIVIAFKAKLGDIETQFSICLPSMELETMLDKFQARNTRLVKRSEATKEIENKQALLNSIKNVEVDLNVVLDEVEINLHDILQLEVNDIITLPKGLNAPVQVLVDNVLWFEAIMGETKHRKAIKIAKLVEKEKVG